MATLPSWLDRPNYVGAMQAGAQLGLSMRAQDQAAEQAAIRNKLEQDALNVQQTRYAAQAAEALRAHNALEAYRQRQLALRESDIANQAKFRAAQMAGQAARDELAQRRLALSEDRAASAEERAAAQLDLMNRREDRLGADKGPSTSQLLDYYKGFKDSGDIESPAAKRVQEMLRERMGIGDIPTKGVQALLDERASLAAKLKANDLYWGPDSLSMGTPRTIQLRDVEAKLAESGWTPEGKRLPSGGAPSAPAPSAAQTLQQGPQQMPTQRFTTAGTPTIDEARQEALRLIQAGKSRKWIAEKFQSVYGEPL